jgi:hypothetical protein
MIKTPWDDDFRRDGYYGFLHFALGQPECVAQFRKATGNTWEPGRTGLDRMIDEATGSDLRFYQEFSDWLVENHYGTPEQCDGDKI